MKRARVAAVAAICAVTASVICWLSTLNEPRRFIFLPGGDVGLGFRSYAGRLEWAEYAPWDPSHVDTAWWSIPWWLVVGCLIAAALILARLLTRSAA